MASSTTRRTRNDTGPPFRSQCLDRNKQPVSLVGATAIRFHLNFVGGANIIDGAGALDDPVNGWVKYDIQPGDLDLEEQDYEQEWEITLADGTVQTFPTGPEKNIVKITRELA